MRQEGVKVLRNIPDYQFFLTADEFDASSRSLAEKYPDVVTLSEIGASREGRPLLCLKIGDGPKNVLMMGCPHPNEPIGAMLLEYFSERLASDEDLRRAYPYTWYIVKVWDIDGYKRNEGWLHGPFTVTNYAKHMFRPAGTEQVDWTFPIDYKQLHFHDCLPETLAMKQLIDNIKPFFIYSLHNSGFGGVYWYLSHELRDIFPTLWAIPKKNGLPLSLGTAESPYCEVYGDAIFSSGGVVAQYEYLEKYSGPNSAAGIRCGDTSSAYARENYGSFSLLTELPYFYDARIENQYPGNVEKREGMIRREEDSQAMSKEIRDILAISEPYLIGNNPFRRTVESFTADRGGRKDAMRKMMETEPEYSEMATVAEELDMLYISKFYKLLTYGMLVRANELALSELDKKEDPDTKARETLLHALDAAKAAFQRVADYLEENLHYSMVPIKNMIAVQLESGLIVLEELERISGTNCKEASA